MQDGLEQLGGKNYVSCKLFAEGNPRVQTCLLSQVHQCLSLFMGLLI